MYVRGLAKSELEIPKVKKLTGRLVPVAVAIYGFSYDFYRRQARATLTCV